MKSFICACVVAAAVLLLQASVVIAQQDLSGLPQPQQDGDVIYITGGIGDEERDALKVTAGDYNLHVMSASADGAFAGSTQITIRDRRGEELLTDDVGPIFYAKLPPGHYVVEATHRDQIRKQNIVVAPGKSQHVHFSWK